MVSKNRLKWISRLHRRKYRDQEGLFLAEGAKITEELLAGGFELLECWIVTPDRDGVQDRDPLSFLGPHREKCLTVSSGELSAVSQLVQPSGVLSVFRKPAPGPLDFSDWVVAVDRLQDPGNLGTLIRSCDWFGIRHLLCSEGTVDVFNHKVVQASMGGLARVQVHYLDLERVLEEARVPVWGTYLDGENIYGQGFGGPGILLFGNESQGIRPDWDHLVDRRLRIPAFRAAHVESLNIGVSAGILMAELRRQQPARN